MMRTIVVGIRYYISRVSGRIDAGAPARQQIYLDALQTVPEISIHMGAFLLSEKFAGLVKFYRTTAILSNRSAS